MEIIHLLQCYNVLPNQVLWEISVMSFEVRMASFQLPERHGDFLMGTILDYILSIPPPTKSRDSKKGIFFEDNFFILIEISMPFLPDPFDNKSAFVQGMAWNIIDSLNSRIIEQDCQMQKQ